MLKIIMILSSLLGMNRSDSSNQSGMIDFIKKTIKEEILSLAAKLLAGFALVGIIIFSVAQAGQAYHLYLIPYTDGLLIEITTYAVLVAACCLGLFFMFKKQPIKIEEANRQSSPLLDVEAIAMQFAEGFFRGFDKPSQQPPTQNPRTAGADI